MKRSKTVIAALTIVTLVTSIFFDVPRTLSVSAQNPDDTKYGTNGRSYPIIEKRTLPDGRSVEEVVGRRWTDGKGRVMEEEYHYRGNEWESGVISITTTIYNPGPDTKSGEKGTLARRVIRRVRKPVPGEKEEELYREEQWFDTDGRTQIRGSKQETDANGRRRVYRWEPGKGYANVTDNASGKSSAKSGYAVASEALSGLDTTVFSTPQGKIRVNLPDDMSAGDTLSGTVSAEPTGQTAETRAQNDGELSGMVVEIEKQRTSTSAAAGGFLKLAIPIATATTYMVLKDKKGSEVARREIPVLAKAPPTETQFDLPTAGQQGRPIQILGPFDGDSGTTQIGIGDDSPKVLAESPRGVIARVPANQKVGPSAIRIGEKGRSVTGAFRTLGIQLSAPKLDLMTGEQTTVAIKVMGLAGLKTAIPLDLENKSPGVVQMAGGNMQRIDISAAMAEGGTYVTERPLTGIQRGAFTITATVIAGRQRPEAESLMAGGPEEGSLMAGGPEMTGGMGIPSPYTTCGTGCTIPRSAKESGNRFCKDSPECRKRGAGCGCHLFRRKKGETGDGEHVADPGQEDPNGSEPLVYDYQCECVKK